MSTQHINLQISGMTCQACASRIEKVLNKKDFVANASVNFAGETAQVEYDDAQTTPEELMQIIQKTGYQAAIQTTALPEMQPENANLWRNHWRTWLLLAIAAPFMLGMTGMLFGVHTLMPPAWLQIALASIVQLWLAIPFYKSAIASVRGGLANMDVLVSIGTLAIYLYSLGMVLAGGGHEAVYFEAGVMVVAFVSLGKYLEERTKRGSLNSRRLRAGCGVNNTGLAVFLDFSSAIKRLGKDVVEARYGNLFQMYEKITNDNPYETPMMIYPAIHYTMGGIWVDYELMTSVPGLFAIGEANFSDHGANRLGASALMQGLADGYFVLPYTIQNYLADQIQVPRFSTDRPEFDEAEKGIQDRIARLMSIKGKQSVDSLHKKLGHIMWDFVGMGREREGLEKAIVELKALKKEFWSDVRIPGKADDLNVELEKALRLADFIEIGELMARDAHDREESCGGHFRLEHQTPEGEALRHDDQFAYVSCWEYQGEDQDPVLLKEPLDYEFVVRQQRNYKN